MNSHDHQIAPFEALGIVVICFGWFIFSSLQSVFSGFANTAFSDNSFAALIALEIILGAIALAVLYARRYALGSLYPVPS